MLMFVVGWCRSFSGADDGRHERHGRRTERRRLHRRPQATCRYGPQRATLRRPAQLRLRRRRQHCRIFILPRFRYTPVPFLLLLLLLLPLFFWRSSINWFYRFFEQKTKSRTSTTWTAGAPVSRSWPTCTVTVTAKRRYTFINHHHNHLPIPFIHSFVSNL